MKKSKDFDKVYRYYDKFMSIFKLYKFQELKAFANLKGNEVVVDMVVGEWTFSRLYCK